MLIVQEKNKDQVFSGMGYIISKPDDIKAGEVLETLVFIPGSWETASGKNGLTQGVKAMYIHGVGKYIKLGADFGRRIVICVQIPAPSVSLANVDKIMAGVKKYPGVNLSRIIACGLSIGAMNWGNWLLSNTTRPKQVYAAILMSGNYWSGFSTKGSYLAGRKILLVHGSEDTQVSPEPNKTAATAWAKAGVDVRLVLVPSKHDDGVWDYFNPQHPKMNVYAL